MQSNPTADVAYPPNATWNDPDFAICLGAKNCTKTYGLHIWNSSYVYIYNAGLYSFFENYFTDTCLSQVNCQINQASIEKSGQVYIYSYYSIGARNLVLMDNQQIVPYNKTINNSTFGQAVAVWGFPENGVVTPSIP
jgi:glucan 1,3-beta-glucosidase